MSRISDNTGDRKILWQELWRHEFEEALQHDPVVIIPTGSVEQHGPHCPMDVDIHTSFHISKEVARRVTDFPVIVTPPVWWGFSHYNMGFPGTITLNLNTYTNLILDVCRSVYANGFKRIVLLNGHGGNRAPNASVVNQISQENVFVLGMSWWELVLDEMSKYATSDGSDVGHGGEWETSVELFLRPQLILNDRMIADRDLTNPFSDEVRRFTPGYGVFAERRRDTEKGTGVMGNALAANPEKGRIIIEAAISRLERIVREYHDMPVRQYKEFGSHCP